MEILKGARNKKEAKQFLKDLDFPILQINELVWTRAFGILIDYGLKDGTGIIDATIAATAIEYDFELWSRNEKHYKLIKALLYKKPY